MKSTVAIAVLLSCAALTTWAAEACAQMYPNRAIRLVVPYPPGGSNDLVGRVLAVKLTDALGQQVIIDNRPGASGIVGTEFAARSAPDGHTLLIGTITTLAINQWIFRSVPYDSARDFAPISLAGDIGVMLLVHSSVPVKSVKELIALARRRPGQLAFASSGIGSATHLGGELLKQTAKIDMIHVPYKGGGPAMIALLSGEVSLSFGSVPASIGFVKQGKLRALAIATEKRSSALPDLPTVSEAGLPGFSAPSWNGLMAPAKTPAAIVQLLNREVVRILNEQGVKEQLAVEGVQTWPSSPAEFGGLISSESRKWSAVIAKSGLKPE